MTVENDTPLSIYTVGGTGPYAINWRYGPGSIVVLVAETDGKLTTLDSPADYSVSPAEGETGNVTLVGATATAYAGRALFVSRYTQIEQGWVAVLGDREVGLAAQLDQIVMAIQEAQSSGSSALRSAAGPVAPIVPADGRVLIWDGNDITNGPTADDIVRAQEYAERAELASGALTSLTDRIPFTFLTTAANAGRGPYALNYDPGTADILSVHVSGVYQSSIQPDGHFTVVAMPSAPSGKGILFSDDQPVDARVDLVFVLPIGHDPVLDNSLDYPSIAALNAAIAGGMTRAAGRTVTAGGSAFAALSGSTILGLPNGYLPAGPWTLKHFGAVGDGVTDDADAIEAALNSGRPICDLGGTYLSSRAIHVAGGLSFVGENDWNTSITFTTGALNVTPASWEDEVYIADMQLYTLEAGVSTAIKINTLHLGAGPGLRNRKRFWVKNVFASGVTAGVNGWKHGVWCDYPFGLKVEGCYLRGLHSGSTIAEADFVAGSSGVCVPDQAVSTAADLEVVDCEISGFQYAGDIYNVESTDFADNDSQNCFHGFSVRNTITRVNQIRVRNNHFSMTGDSLIVENARQLICIGNEFSWRAAGAALPITSTLIAIKGVNSYLIEGNSIRGNITNDLGAIVNGITIERSSIPPNFVSENGIIQGNSFVNLHLAVKMVGTVGHVVDTIVVDNVYDGIRNPLIVDSGSQGDTRPKGTAAGAWVFSNNRYDSARGNISESVANTQLLVLGVSEQYRRMTLATGAAAYDVNVDFDLTGLTAAHNGAYFDFYIQLPAAADRRLILRNGSGGAVLATMSSATLQKYSVRVVFNGAALGWQVAWINQSVFI